MRRNMAVIIDGKKVSQEIKDEVKEKVAALKEKGIEVTLYTLAHLLVCQKAMPLHKVLKLQAHKLTMN